MFNSRNEKKNDPGKGLEGSDMDTIGTGIHFWREVTFNLEDINGDGIGALRDSLSSDCTVLLYLVTIVRYQNLA